MRAARERPIRSRPHGTYGTLAAPSPVRVRGRARRGGPRALAQRGLYIGRPSIFVQKVAKSLVGEFLDCLHRLAREQVKRLPGLGIEFHELAPRIGRLLGHDDLLINWNNGAPGPFIARWFERKAPSLKLTPPRRRAGAKSSCVGAGSAFFSLLASPRRSFSHYWRC